MSWDANRNFYEDFTAFWRIRGSDSGDAPLNWTLAEWREHWGADHENLSGTGRVVWQQPPDASRPPHLILPADYALSLGEDNPARGAAGDGRNVGAILEQLPPPPASRTPKAE